MNRYLGWSLCALYLHARRGLPLAIQVPVVVSLIIRVTSVGRYPFPLSGPFVAFSFLVYVGDNSSAIPGLTGNLSLWRGNSPSISTIKHTRPVDRSILYVIKTIFPTSTTIQKFDRVSFQDHYVSGVFFFSFSSFYRLHYNSSLVSKFKVINNV